MRKNWVIRLATFGLWLLAAGSAVYWMLKFVQTTATPANAAVVVASAQPEVDGAALARSLGGGLVAPLAATGLNPVASSINASRFVLTGVVVGRSERQSIALIAIDGKPARPYAVGVQLETGVVLQSVRTYQAMLGSSPDAPASVTLEMPKQFSAVAGSAIPVVAPVAPLIATTLAPPTVVLPASAAIVTPPLPNMAGSNLANPNANTAQNPARPGASRARPTRQGAADLGTQGTPEAVVPGSEAKK